MVTYIRIYNIHKCIHTYVRAYICTYIHIHIHMHIQCVPNLFKSFYKKYMQLHAYVRTCKCVLDPFKHFQHTYVANKLISMQNLCTYTHTCIHTYVSVYILKTTTYVAPNFVA